MAANDRRVRLRPKDGASALYYSGSASGPVGATNFRQDLLSQALGKTPTLPWLSNSPLSSLSPTAPNFVGNIGSDIAGIGAAINSNDAADIASAIAAKTGINTSNINLSFTDAQTLSVGGLTNSLFGGSTKSLGGASNILSPLSQTNGLVFPYTPTIDFVQQIDYSSFDPVHSNQELHTYQRTKAPAISITGEFTSQNANEASYSLAVFHFCRAVSKMAFGQSANAGTPPPILLISAYGEYMLQDVPVILTNFNISFPKDVDYVPVPNSTSFVPSMFTLSLSLIVQNTPTALRSFSLEKFRSGQSLKKGWT